LVRDFWRGWEGRGENIFNLTCLIQFLEGERRGANSLQDPCFASPKLEFFEEEGKRSL